MQTVDCPWEIANIGKRTLQFNYSFKDSYNTQEVRECLEGYKYVVAKVPCGNMNVFLGLQQDGFTVMETQMSLSKKIKDFNTNDRLLIPFRNRISYNLISSEDGLKEVLSRMTSGMFSTDRIYLDPYFGPEVGLHRYRNWVKSEFSRGSILFEFSVDGNAVGFGLRRMEGDTSYGLLGGVYEQYQREGYGILTAANNCLFSTAMGFNDIKQCKTAISSNNKPMLDFYNYLQFKIYKIEYVLVKHL